MLRSSAGVPGGIGIVRIEEGKEPGRVYQMHKDTLSIGRSRESGIFLEDLAVSRLHASIINLGNNTYALRDEGSANGTKVNGLQYPNTSLTRSIMGVATTNPANTSVTYAGSVHCKKRASRHEQQGFSR